ncbi:MAG: sigma-70 family RNA polymerase sigma factor [Clostridia bacterium]|nr:sigma-70 family RNA polymerase sigma factor [Clostridia bacterium]
MDDRKMIRDAQTAVVRMMEAYGDSIVRLCCLYLKDANLAQDAAQETFLKAFRHYESFRGESSEKTWLTRIALRTCRDMTRGAWYRLVDRSVTPESVSPSMPDEKADYGEVAEVVMALDEKYRVPILLYYYQELQAKEIASILHLPIGTVLSRLKRGREKIKEQLQKGGVPFWL